MGKRRKKKARVEVHWENPAGGGLRIRRPLWGAIYEREVPRLGFVTVVEAAILLRVSRPTVYAMVERDELKARTVGGRLMVPVSEIRRRLAGE